MRHPNGLTRTRYVQPAEVDPVTQALGSAHPLPFDRVTAFTLRPLEQLTNTPPGGVVDRQVDRGSLPQGEGQGHAGREGVGACPQAGRADRRRPALGNAGRVTCVLEVVEGAGVVADGQVQVAVTVEIAESGRGVLPYDEPRDHGRVFLPGRADMMEVLKLMVEIAGEKVDVPVVVVVPQGRRAVGADVDRAEVPGHLAPGHGALADVLEVAQPSGLVSHDQIEIAVAVHVHQTGDRPAADVDAGEDGGVIDETGSGVVVEE